MALENAREARKEPGCRQFDVLVDPKDKTKGHAVRDLQRRAGLRSAPADAAFQEVPRRAVPLLASRERQVFTRAAP